MTETVAWLRAVYDVHGVGVEVHAHDAAVLEAMALRLRDFRADEAPAAAVRLEFTTEAPDPPSGASRQVSDTPYGSLHYFPESDALCGNLGGATLRCDARGGVASVHCARFAARRLYLATHPLSTISLMEMLERRGLFSLHAGCLSDGTGRGVLLAGPSGSGKSTLSLALARLGLRFLSDDVVFLAASPSAHGPLRVLGFGDAVAVTESTARLFPELATALAEDPAPGFPKRLVRIEDALAAARAGTCAPHALVFPQVDAGKPSAITELDGGSALLRLVPDVLLTDPDSSQAHLTAIAALLDQVPCYVVRSGADLARAAELVAGLF